MGCPVVGFIWVRFVVTVQLLSGVVMIIVAFVLVVKGRQVEFIRNAVLEEMMMLSVLVT